MGNVPKRTLGMQRTCLVQTRLCKIMQCVLIKSCIISFLNCSDAMSNKYRIKLLSISTEMLQNAKMTKATLFLKNIFRFGKAKLGWAKAGLLGA